MSHEWAIFNDEGLLAAFVSRSRAQANLDEMQANPETHDEHAYVGPICPEHSEQCAWNCEICNAEEDDDHGEHH